MRVAAIYDVHGNLPALEAVLGEVPGDVDAIVFGGDLVWGPWSGECLALAESLGGRARFPVAERTVVCGHTHLQYDCELVGHRVVNPESVGAPTERPVAWWALLGPDVELRTTSHDTEATISAAAEIVPDVDPFARWLRETPSPAERVAALGGVG